MLFDKILLFLIFLLLYMEMIFLSSPLPNDMISPLWYMDSYAILESIVCMGEGILQTKFLMNQKLATRIGIITTAITLTGMFLLWFGAETGRIGKSRFSFFRQKEESLWKAERKRF